MQDHKKTNGLDEKVKTKTRGKIELVKELKTEVRLCKNDTRIIIFITVNSEMLFT